MKDNKSAIMVLSGDDYKRLQEQLDRDTTKLLDAEIRLHDSEKNNIELNKRVKELELEVLLLKTRNEIQGGFIEDYLRTIEGIDDSDESFLSYEHRDEYVRAAKYMQQKYGRVNNRIRQMEDKMNSLPY